MKKITLMAIVIAATSLTACKKDRTCECTTTSTTTAAGASQSSTDTDKTVMTKVTKGTARANCLSTKYTYTGTQSGVSYTTVQESNCSLK